MAHIPVSTSLSKETTGTKRSYPILILDSKILHTYCSLTLVHLIPFWLVREVIEVTVHLDLPKRPICQFKPVQQSKERNAPPEIISPYCLGPHKHMPILIIVCKLPDFVYK
jgi:hypothetical protein